MAADTPTNPENRGPNRRFKRMVMLAVRLVVYSNIVFFAGIVSLLYLIQQNQEIALNSDRPSTKSTVSFAKNGARITVPDPKAGNSASTIDPTHEGEGVFTFEEKD